MNSGTKGGHVAPLGYVTHTTLPHRSESKRVDKCRFAEKMAISSSVSAKILSLACTQTSIIRQFLDFTLHPCLGTLLLSFVFDLSYLDYFCGRTLQESA
jgi:hypothetical protein